LLLVTRSAGFMSSRRGNSYPKRESSVTNARDPKLALLELYLSTAEKVGDRRAQANAGMLSVNSAIVALYGYLQSDKIAVGTGQKAIWLWAIPAAGAIVCLAWTALLTSYRKLNRAKFGVLMQLEKDLAVSLFTSEQDLYTKDKRRSLSYIETAIPGCFFLLYAAILARNMPRAPSSLTRCC
jgi:hypothetical protein